MPISDDIVSIVLVQVKCVYDADVTYSIDYDSRVCVRVLHILLYMNRIVCDIDKLLVKYATIYSCARHILNFCDQ